MPSTHASSDIHMAPAELLQRLIRFDTTNPPGNEADIVAYINDLITGAGIDTTTRALDPNRPNLIARLKGRGDAPPLLLHAHVDVVTTANQQWQHDPFGGELIDGYIWGRGALDMKNTVAMYISALLRIKEDGVLPAGDILLAIMSDEENGGNYGAKFLVENHPELFDSVRYSIGESGGFTLYVAGQKFYPIQVAEKQQCVITAVMRGPGGHGSTPIKGGAMAKLGRVLTTLDTTRLPVHINPVIEKMVNEMAPHLPGDTGAMLPRLLDPETTDATLEAIGPLSRNLMPLFHNTVSPTIVSGGFARNVIPSEIILTLDTRLLPGYTRDDIFSELGALLGDDAELQLVRYDPYPGNFTWGLYDTLAEILHEADPDGVTIPNMLAGVTDGRHLARLGIENYGFTPMLLPDGFTFSTVHAADERVPADALEFGTRAVYKLLERYNG
jgi:acetylornithine deacetylase/succinyl-diaminopimelate desuccinylase-like protein